ncbi:hypothetical protein [Leptolyngbya sp. NIES-2104]|uniref:hypothetical protein n=1 Tax=Leptolyngbya sp. NIES-2104 TaxID=1552121 RepID=UPI0006EC6D10|nr:hypothetical protein [Leptolyngbya sp. NIES-2104]GAP96598.1 hypothetical protein NIES2104_31410 [Leptolyngbya sp. NIES-2104]
MSPNLETFGRRVNQIGSIAELLAMETEEARSESFRQLDRIVGEVLVRSLRGERIATIVQDHLNVNTVLIQGLSNEHRGFLTTTFGLEHQQSRGAWFLPESANLRVGMMSLPWAFREHDRFATGIALEERGKVLLNSSADAIFTWAILEPLFNALFLPFELRGNLSGTLTREEMLQRWDAIETLYQTLGFQVADELAVMRWSGGWNQLRTAEQLEAKQRLLKALARQAQPQMATCYRAFRVRELVNGYYKKAKRDGQVKRKQALTKGLAPSLTGFFGGDWLVFLTYLGEKPHPEEQIITALPETRPFVGGASRATEVAALQGIAAEEIERIAAAYWQQSSGQSPVEQRVATLERYWSAFDGIHARQAVGMQPLWGLVEDYRFLNFNETVQSPYQPQLYQALLPNDLLSEIERLWGTVMLVKFPDRIVSELFPHELMAETFGAALKFWHGCALTAWFLCEGPYSRTDMAGLAHYYRREIAALEACQTPIDPKIFDELMQAEAQLGPAEPIYNSQESSPIAAGGLSLTIRTSLGSRRTGFEKLRDIITRHRQTWSAQYLDRYFRARWESEITEAGRIYHLLLHERGGKSPTLKQFAKSSAVATNHWFGGDVSGLYGAIREKSPVQSQRLARMPADRVLFARAVYEGMPPHLPKLVSEEIRNQNYQLLRLKEELANLSLRYVQLEEALGRTPEPAELGLEKLQNYGQILGQDLNAVWNTYAGVIQKAKH